MNSIIKAAFKFLSHWRHALPGALIAVGVLAGIVATATASSNTSEEVAAYIQSLGDPAPVPEPSENSPGGTTKIEVADGTEFTCESKRYDLTARFDEIVALNPNADSLWAGSLVQGTSVPDGAPVTIPLERGGPVEITVVSSGGAVIGSRTVEVPSLAVVGQAVNDIVNAFEGDTAAKISFTKQEGHSFEQSMLQLGLSAKWFSGSLKASLDMDSKAETNSLYIKYVQEYYTVVTSPLRPDTVFAPQVTVDDLKFYANEANLPAYVSSVTYGRMLIIKMTSTAEHGEMKVAFDYAYDPPGPNQGNVFGNAKNESILNNSSLDIVVLGGSAGDGIELIKTNGSSLKQYLDSGANFPKAFLTYPISYKISYLKDNSLAKVGFNTEYSIRECNVNSQEVFVDFDRMYVGGDCDGVGKGEFYWEFNVLRNGEEDEPPVERKEADHTSRNGGEEIRLAESRRIVRQKKSGELIQITGWVRESDDGDDDKTDEDTYVGPVNERFLYPVPTNRQSRVVEMKKDSGCWVNLYYTIGPKPPGPAGGN